jgi:DNA-binding transcriptional LysR family regulator
MNLSAVDLNLFVVFDALMSERGVTRAAAKVGLSQPAVSNALARLRAQFADPLFLRAGKAMVPTPRALEIAPDVETALARLRGVLRQPEFHPEESAAVFRIGTTDEVELRLFPLLVRRLEAASAVSIQSRRLSGLYRVPEEELRAGTLDFGIGAFGPSASTDAALIFRELYAPRYVSIARRGHPEVRGKLDLRLFCKLRHVATFYPGSGPGLIDRILEESGRRRRVVLSLPDWLSVPFVVAQSDLIATVPEGVARAANAARGLQILKCPVRIPRLPMNLVWHARTHESAPHRWFRALTIDAARDAGDPAAAPSRVRRRPA